MSDAEDQRKWELTFSQEQGVLPLPKQLELNELSTQLRTKLWTTVYIAINGSSEPLYSHTKLDKNVRLLCFKIHTEFFIRPADSFSTNNKKNMEPLKNFILIEEWHDVLSLIQFMLRKSYSQYITSNLFLLLKKRVASDLHSCYAAYTLVDDGRTIAPAATSEEADALKRTFDDLQANNFEGAKLHLTQSIEALNKGDFAASVRESVHAVESVARRIDGAASTLTPALKRLASAQHIHPALAQGYEKIYGYTSDEGGVRHASLSGEIAVEQEDALYMLGSCAAFVSYMIVKARRAGIVG